MAMDQDLYNKLLQASYNYSSQQAVGQDFPSMFVSPSTDSIQGGPMTRIPGGPGGGGGPGGPGSFQKVPFATRPIDSGSINDKSKSKSSKTGGGPPSFEDYLASLGLGSGDFSANLPAAPDMTGMVQDQYGGVLDFLRRSIGRTENKGEKRDEDLKEIYHAMAGLSKKSGKKIARQGRKSTKKIGNLYDNLNRRRDESIQRDTGAVGRRMSELGIDAATPASSARLLKESAQDHRLIARQQGRAESTARNQGQNWANFAKTGAQSARLEGAQQRADLSQNIADTVFALQGQIAQTKAEKAQAMMQAKLQEYQMAADAAQADQAAAMQKAGFAQQYQDMMSQANAPGDMGDLTGYDYISQILRNEAKQEPGLNRKDAANALEALQGFVPQMTGRPDAYGQTQDMQVQDYYRQLEEQASAAGISPELYRSIMTKQAYDQLYGG